MGSAVVGWVLVVFRSIGGSGLSLLKLLIHCLFAFLICTSHLYPTFCKPLKLHHATVSGCEGLLPLYPLAVVRHASPASRLDQLKEIPHRRIKQKTGGRGGGGGPPCDGVQIASQARSLLRRGSHCATEAFHFVVIANCNSPRHMISPDDNRESRQGSWNLLFALKWRRQQRR